MAGCHEAGAKPDKYPEKPIDEGLVIAVAGNPNCGKSALFNAFTGIRQGIDRLRF